MREAKTGLRAALGGAICGSFLGIFGGGLVGLLGGMLLGNITLGLDGAIAGGAVLALAGAIYGVVFYDYPARFHFGRRRIDQEQNELRNAHVAGHKW
jgi:hypothetical protein